ncbi:hypothetical protein [Chitinilyticum piscinae]|uniref:DUF4149 domain-containing protein n=1 Tax=Chitinilyticum piscinae TaxID=2866724 RepID=A0A8J7FYM0_9NEIS|nr:hypothetical protein [Chitinilyticum piscinae]MBE9608750.1 hypothetical protein [Chitinilyticum piscinae]
MDWNAHALWRGLHVLAVVFWIGGVAFVTTVLLPALRRQGCDYAAFDALERRFACQARITTQLAFVSGMAMLWLSDSWARLRDTWWLWAMLATWAIFTLMLFVLEPIVLHGRLQERARHDPAGTLQLLQRLHYALLALALLTMAGGIIGAHGGAWF